MNNTLGYAALMLVAGLGIPIMAALNGSLGTKLQSPALAATILFSVGWVIAITYLLITEGLPPTIYLPETPWYFYLGGLLVMFYILSITWVGPRFGIANAVAFVLLGQLVAMTCIDHFGLFGAPQYTLGSQRLMGLFLMAMGVLMVLKTSAANT